MPGRGTAGAIRQIEALYREGTVAGLTDGQLLRRFASRRDEASFAALVGRHGPMVLGICRRIVRDPHEAEDAFQASFLVLVRKAGSVHVDDSLGRWLSTVSRRIALRAEAARLGRAGGLVADRAEEGDDPAGRGEVRSAVRDELGRLPESYRSVLLACYVDGLSHAEAARRLGWPLGSVKGRLARARRLLRDRLARRGLAPAAGALAATARPREVSAALFERTVTAAIGFSGGRATSAGLSPAAVALAKEALGAMGTIKLKLAAVGFLAFGVGMAGVGLGRPSSAPARADDGAAAREVDGQAGGQGLDEGGSTPDLSKRWHTLDAEARRHRDRIRALETQVREVEQKRAEVEATLRRRGAAIVGPAGERAAGPAIEGARRNLPEYVVEPPDMLRVEALEALPGRPITGERLVRPDGTMSLGFYGDLPVAGLTLAQVKEKVVLHLRQYLTDEALGLLERGGDAPARVVALGDSPRVSVDVAAYNSKVYYVEGDVRTPGRFNVTGNDTVLDAINYAGGLLAGAKVRLVRPAPRGGVGDQVLPVDLDAIIKRGDATTNYQLLPRDRIVAEVGDLAFPVGDARLAQQRRIGDRIDAMIRELEGFRKELKESR